MSREARRQEEAVKQKIVEGYRRGVCNHNGGYMPPEKRGMAGKGSHYVAPLRDCKAYAKNYARIFDKQ